MTGLNVMVGYTAGNIGTISNLSGQGVAFNSKNIEVNSAVTGAASAISGQIGNIREASGYAKHSAFTKGAGVLGFAQVGINLYNNDGNVQKLTIGDLLTVGASVASLIPGGQLIAVALTIGGVAYSIYESKNGSITLGDILPDHDEYNLELEVEDNYKAYQNLNRSGQTRTYDPLALDLDGDGLETVGTNRFSGSLFDHNRDDIRTATGWVAADDGFLVYDRNGNGMIDHGGELFGDNTLLADGSRAAHGYAALAELDTDGNGKVDAADQDFSSLRVWRDLNQDGISQSGELFALADVGVQALNLAHTNPNTNLGNGNFLAQSGSYTKSDGSPAQMGDLDLAADLLFSRHSEAVELTDEQRQAPNLQGMGWLRDLREAAALSGSLSAVLAAYVEVVNDAIWEWGFKVA